jgi:hypothetical protein
VNSERGEAEAAPKLDRDLGLAAAMLAHPGQHVLCWRGDASSVFNSLVNVVETLGLARLSR